MSSFLVNIFCTYCSNLERNPSLKKAEFAHFQISKESKGSLHQKATECTTALIKTIYDLGSLQTKRYTA